MVPVGANDTDGMGFARGRELEMAYELTRAGCTCGLIGLGTSMTEMMGR